MRSTRPTVGYADCAQPSIVACPTILQTRLKLPPRSNPRLSTSKLKLPSHLSTNFAHQPTMTEQQPPNVVEGATGDIDDERPAVKSAEDRKAASALASLDTAAGDDAASKNVDQDAVGQAMKNLGGSTGPGAGKGGSTTAAAAAAPKKAVKVDAADVALLVQELELPKAKVTELLKAHDGDAVATMRAYVTPAF